MNQEKDLNTVGGALWHFNSPLFFLPIWGKKQTVYQKYCIWQNNISQIKSKIKVLPNNQKLRELLLIDLSYKKS